MKSMVNRLVVKSRFVAVAFAGVTSASHPTRLFSAAPGNNDNYDIKLSIKGTPEYESIGINHEENKFLFMTSICAPFVDTQNRSSIDLVCVLDESGSMGGEPIELLKKSMKFIVSNLTSNDRFGCIGYETIARQICPFKYMTSGAKNDALRQIDSMEALNTTALCEGLEMGVDMMRECKIQDNTNDIDNKNRVKNVLLLTDGVANVGYTDPKDIIRALTDKQFAEKGRVRRTKHYRSDMTTQLEKYAKTAAKFTELKPENNDDDVYKTLPCNIDTFGFGTHHDDMMLKMISEYGRGLYAFISDKEDIVGTFGEMLGGMLSVIGKDIKIRIRSLNDNVVISKCLAIDSDNKTMELKEIEKDKNYEISILNDIQSEETRDLLFEISIPKINVVDDNWNYIQIECEYLNVLTNELQQVSTICKIQRSKTAADNKENKIRNYDIDIQYNRMITINAIKEALYEANNGNLDKAKQIIIDAQNEIKNSVSKHDEYCISLIKDLDNCVSGMESKATYNEYGRKYGISFAASTMLQRSYQSESFIHDHGKECDQSVYQSIPTSTKHWKTKSKSVWRAKSKK